MSGHGIECTMIYTTKHGLRTFHLYCFAKEVYALTVHKPLVAMFSKDVATVVATHHAMYTSVQCVHSVQTRP